MKPPALLFTQVITLVLAQVFALLWTPPLYTCGKCHGGVFTGTAMNLHLTQQYGHFLFFKISFLQLLFQTIHPFPFSLGFIVKRYCVPFEVPQSSFFVHLVSLY